jgi:hypothetical protein
MEIISSLIQVHLKTRVVTQENMCIDLYHDLVDPNFGPEAYQNKVFNQFKEIMNKAKYAEIRATDVFNLFFNFMRNELRKYKEQAETHKEWMNRINEIDNEVLCEFFEYITRVDISGSFIYVYEFRRLNFINFIKANILDKCDANRIEKYILETKVEKRITEDQQFYKDLYNSMHEIWNATNKEEFAKWCKKKYIIDLTEQSQHINYLATQLLITHNLSGTSPTKSIYLFTVSGQSTVSSWHGANVMMFVSPTRGIYIIYVDDGHLTKLWLSDLSRNKKTFFNNRLMSFDDKVFDHFETKYGIKMYNYKTLETIQGYEKQTSIIPNPKWTIKYITPVRGFLIDVFNECNMIGFKEPEQQGGVLSSALKILIIAILVIVVIVCVVIYIHDKYWFKPTKAKPKI